MDKSDIKMPDVTATVERIREQLLEDQELHELVTNMANLDLMRRDLEPNEELVCMGQCKYLAKILMLVLEPWTD